MAQGIWFARGGWGRRHSKTSHGRRHTNRVFKRDWGFKEDVHSQSQEEVCEGTITERSVTYVGHEENEEFSSHMSGRHNPNHGGLYMDFVL